MIDLLIVAVCVAPCLWCAKLQNDANERINEMLRLHQLKLRTAMMQRYTGRHLHIVK